MILKGLVEEDFVNYKKPSMFIICPRCTFKCEKECGRKLCQNSSLSALPEIYISNDVLVDKYINNPITHSIVFGGLEPFDTYTDVYELIKTLREQTQDDIVIYTGYTKEELLGCNVLQQLKEFKHIIIKYGRFIPDDVSHYDDILGVKLASTNQYAEEIS